MNTQDLPPLMTVKEASRYMGLSPIRVRQLCQEGKLGTKVGDGTLWVIRRSQLRRFCAARDAKKSREKSLGPA